MLGSQSRPPLAPDAGKLGVGEPVHPGAVVELEQNSKRTLCFLGPKAGGTEVTLEGREILVTTPQSPLGRHLEGKEKGDRLELTLAGVRDQCRIISVG